MSRASANANAVVYAAEQVCALYGVQCTREQSRVINVEGAAGRWRPMFFGKWTDDEGNVHNSGRADLLARPRVWFSFTGEYAQRLERFTVPLWIECKSGKGRLTPDQIAFKKWVEDNGDHYVLIHDDVRPLIAWFDAHGVKKEPKRIIHAEPIDATALDGLPCRWCGDLKNQHRGKILACVSKLGKVWSPKLQK
jgi:hypothetical protein